MSDDPRAAGAALPELILQWRKAADAFGANPFSDAHCLRVCAQQLETALRAGADAREARQQEKVQDTVARGDKWGNPQADLTRRNSGD